MSNELRKLAAARMASERPGHTFLATTLVHPKQPLSTASPRPTYAPASETQQDRAKKKTKKKAKMKKK